MKGENMELLKAQNVIEVLQKILAKNFTSIPKQNRLAKYYVVSQRAQDILKEQKELLLLGNSKHYYILKFKNSSVKHTLNYRLYLLVLRMTFYVAI